MPAVRISLVSDSTQREPAPDERHMRSGSHREVLEAREERHR